MRAHTGNPLCVQVVRSVTGRCGHGHFHKLYAHLTHVRRALHSYSYRHRATASLRANATSMIRLVRGDYPTVLAAYQRASELSL
jgi:hypothetical protein